MARARKAVKKTAKKNVAKIGPAKKNPAKKNARKKAVKLLAGGNPQVSKGEGNAPVQAYIAAIPDWKKAVARRVDALITRAVPGVRKAVKWNSPFYGVAGGGWVISFHCFTKYIKVAFFNGASLKPPPPGASKQNEVRYLDIHETDKIDEARFISWARQAGKRPGWLKV